MALYETFKLIHILAAIVWIGGGTVLLILTIRARSTSIDATAVVARAGAQVGSLFGAAGGVAFLAGVLMLLQGGFDRAEWEQLWIVWGIVAFLVSSFLGGRLISPRYESLATAAEGGDGAAVASAVGSLTTVALVDLALLTSTVAAMTFKWTL